MKQIKKPFYLILIALLILSGCTATPKPNSPVDESSRIFIDLLEREINIPEIPKKVISLSPALSEILFALELDEKIVGTTNYCDYPEAALSTTKVGDFSNPNFEVIIANEPDLIFLASGVQTNLIDSLENLGLKTICIDAVELDDVLENIAFIGEIMGAEEKALEIVTDMQARIDTVTNKVKDFNKPLVFFEIWDEPLTTAGPGTFIDNLIDLAGGENMIRDANRSFPQIDLEILIDRDPDVYFAVQHKSDLEITGRPGYEVLQAVQNNRVFTIEDDWVTMPAPRIILGLEEMARLIHPEAFQ